MKKVFLSTSADDIIRIFSFLAIFILILININFLFSVGLNNVFTDYYHFFIFVLNCFSIIILSIFLIFPSILIICSFLCFLYASTFIILTPSNNLGVLMYWLFNIILYAKGHFKKYTIAKIFLSIFIFTF